MPWEQDASWKQWLQEEGALCRLDSTLLAALSVVLHQSAARQVCEWIYSVNTLGVKCKWRQIFLSGTREMQCVDNLCVHKKHRHTRTEAAWSYFLRLCGGSGEASLVSQLSIVHRHLRGKATQLFGAGDRLRHLANRSSELGRFMTLQLSSRVIVERWFTWKCEKVWNQCHQPSPVLW